MHRCWNNTAQVHSKGRWGVKPAQIYSTFVSVFFSTLIWSVWLFALAVCFRTVCISGLWRVTDLRWTCAHARVSSLFLGFCMGHQHIKLESTFQTERLYSLKYRWVLRRECAVPLVKTCNTFIYFPTFHTRTFFVKQKWTEFIICVFHSICEQTFRKRPRVCENWVVERLCANANTNASHVLCALGLNMWNVFNLYWRICLKYGVNMMQNMHT